jgi:hypothetical protein
MQEVSGSIPLTSTKILEAWFFDRVSQIVLIV